MRHRDTDPATRERREARRQRFYGTLRLLGTTRRGTALWLMVLAVLLVFAGICNVYGPGWAMIVSGVWAGVLSLMTGWER